MAKPRESPKAAIVVVTLLLIPLLIGGSYVVGYFVCSWSAPWDSERMFANEWQFNFYRPLTRLEQWQREVTVGYSGPDLEFVQTVPILADPRGWTLANGQEFVGEYLGRTGEAVRLQTYDGDIVVPLDSLSEWDREWVEGE